MKRRVNQYKMASSKRILTDLVLCESELPQHKIKIASRESNIHEILFLLFIEDTGFEYLGKLILPQNFPFSAPKIRFITPTGFFRSDEDVCLTLVSHIHNDEWTPIWRIHTILIAIKSFIYEKIQTQTPQQKKLAEESSTFNKTRDEIKMFS